jgi:DNA-binding CsgD family transcriptional regulator
LHNGLSVGRERTCLAHSGEPRGPEAHRSAREGPPARVLSVVPLIGAVKDKELALARVAIFIRDLQAAVPSTSDLQACFGLTEAEARLARILAQGHSLVEAAAQSGISIHTARAHLKQIFGKTGTHRQADLIRMLEGLARCPLLGN